MPVFVKQFSFRIKVVLITMKCTDYTDNTFRGYIFIDGNKNIKHNFFSSIYYDLYGELKAVKMTLMLFVVRSSYTL